ELLTGERLFQGDHEASTFANVVSMAVPPPSQRARDVSPELDALVLRGLARAADERFTTAREMAIAVDRIAPRASPHGIGEWVEASATDVLATRSRALHEIEAISAVTGPIVARAAYDASGRSAPGASATSERSASPTREPPRRSRRLGVAAAIVLVAAAA